MDLLFRILTALPGTPEQWANALITILLTIAGTRTALRRADAAAKDRARPKSTR